MSSMNLFKVVADFEKEIVVAALIFHDGNMLRAAKDLGVTYRQLRWLSRKHGLDEGRRELRRKG